MPPATPPKSAILYQSPSKAITLLDIPLSISLAQGTASQPHRDRIYSSEPLQHPYPSTEPKSQKARNNVMRAMVGSTAPAFPAKLLYEALEEIRANYPGNEWCLPRQVLTSLAPARGSEEPQLAMDDSVCDGDGRSLLVEPEIQIPVYGKSSGAAKWQSVHAMCKVTVYIFKDLQAIAYRLIYNPHPTLLSLSIVSHPQSYSIPAGSAFYLANIDKRSAAHFSSAAQALYSAPTASAGPGQFDLILLDPPWDNRSARRSEGYLTMRQQLHPMNALKGMLGQHIAPNGLVACWITNNPSARTWVMEAFETWGVELFEEWAWLKTTATNIPVTDIEGVWRKPYEVLLLGRQVDYFVKDDLIRHNPEQPEPQRVIVAVPDIHSRKPCLKELLESAMPDPLHYRALEVFARNLTADKDSPRQGHKVMTTSAEPNVIEIQFITRVSSSFEFSSGFGFGLQLIMSGYSRSQKNRPGWDAAAVELGINSKFGMNVNLNLRIHLEFDWAVGLIATDTPLLTSVVTFI